jgi:HAD superfamily hydrolase (TIGR01509 family)
MRLQGAIFDMDGTLLNSMFVWDSLGSDLLRELGIEPEPGLDAKLKTMSLHGAAEYCKKTCGLSQSEEEIVALVDAKVDRFYREEVTAKPGADKLLSLLKMEGVWMYLATATDRPQAEAALRHTGLDRYFRGILTCSEIGAGKDSPLIFEKCLTRLRCRRDACVVFEDSLHAIQTAKEAGFQVAAVYDASSEADQPEIRKLADYYIRSYDEFFDTIRNPV